MMNFNNMASAYYGTLIMVHYYTLLYIWYINYTFKTPHKTTTKSSNTGNIICNRSQIKTVSIISTTLSLDLTILVQRLYTLIYRHASLALLLP